MNERIAADIRGDIFDFTNLIEKFEREIDRFCEAQYGLDEIEAIDFALNAAFTGFHLLEWEAKTNSPDDKRSARDLLEDKNSEDLNLLHDIVTRTKHVTVGNRAYDADVVEVRTSAGNSHAVGMDDEGNQSWTRVRKIFVKFGDKRAEQILLNVRALFRDEEAVQLVCSD